MFRKREFLHKAWAWPVGFILLWVGVTRLLPRPGAEGAEPRQPLPLTGFEPGPTMDRVVPGQFLIDPPTLENLGFRWYIQGDSNRNASVTVAYRKKGDREWREALPMLRVHHEIANQVFGPYRTGNLFAGSVLGLQPGTTYEVKFTLRDPDGGAPSEPKVVTVSTRSEPPPSRGLRYLHVYPPEYRGRRSQGGFTNLQAALDAARPGDVLLLHAGVYRGPFTLKRSGKPGSPIVLRGRVDGEAILEGPDLKTDLLNIEGVRYLTIEDLTLRRTRTAISAGGKGGPGVVGLVVRRCRINEAILGINTLSENSAGWFIADNEITGINPTWYPRPQDYMSPSHTGVNVYGQGHVVCYNRISRFSDSLAIANFGPPVKDLAKHCVAIDFYNNDLSWAQDDTIETDYGCHNIRVYRNRCYDAHTALSVQPSYGGPIYLIRNEAYAITSLTFKLHNYCTGIEAYNNTVCCAGSGFSCFDRWQNGHFRNNLFMGARGYAMETGSMTPYTTLDYNGYRRNEPERLIKWRAHDGQIGRYNSLEEFHKATGFEAHGVMVDFDLFMKAEPPRRGATYFPDRYDLRLRPGSAAVDAGVALPTVTEGYTGKAPDLGCYEIGQPVPHYGPRPRPGAKV